MARQPGAAPAGGGLVERLRGAVVVLALAWLIPSAAHADDVPVGSPGGHYRSVLQHVPAGIEATLLAGRTPAIALRTDRAVVIFGEQGEEMARITPTGIEVNDASSTWRVTAESRGEAPGTGWRVLHDALFTWLEPRARPVTTDRAPRAWRVPVSVDGRRAAITGQTKWVEPPAGQADSSIPRVAVAALVVATAGLALWQRRRGAASGGLSSRES